MPALPYIPGLGLLTVTSLRRREQTRSLLMKSCLKCLPARSYCGGIRLNLSPVLELGEQRCGQGYRGGGRNRRLEGGRAGGIQLRLKSVFLIVGVFFDLDHHDLLNCFANGNTPIRTSELEALKLDRLHLILSAASNVSLQSWPAKTDIVTNFFPPSRS
jgi:hypothetical protein